jgi:hypothetical protein
MSQVPHTFIINSIWLKIFYFFLEIMALCMATFYKPQTMQMNEKPTPESSLDLMLTQHLHDENPASQEMRARLEINPPRAWYYRIFLNFHTLMILLQVGPTFGDEPEIVYESCYETKDTSIFAWFSILGVGHYYWLRGPIRRLPSSHHSMHLRFLAVMSYHCDID